MATFSEHVKIFIDFVETKAGGKAGLGGALNEIKQAEGGLNKLKAAGSGVSSAIGGLGWSAVAAGAGAAAVFVGKAVKAFENLALSAEKFGAATGLAVDDASRWIEVAGDIGIEAGTLESAFAKLNSTIAKNPEKLEEFGAAIVYAKDGSVDLNETIINVIGALDKMDPAARAAAMKELFGKGAAGAAELFNQSVSEIRDNLEAVGDAQVIDKDEVEKAKRLRAATDTLADSWNTIVLIVGEAAAEFAPVLEMMSKVVEKAEQLNAITGKEGGGLFEMFTGRKVDFNAESWGAFFDGILHGAEDTDEAVKSVGDSIALAGDKAGTLGENVAEAGTRGFEAAQRLADNMALAGDKTGGAAERVKELRDEYDKLMGRLSEENAALDIADGFDKVHEAAVKAWGATAEGADDAEASQRDAQRAVNDLAIDVGEYLTEVLKIPPEQATDIIAMIDRGELAEAEAALAGLEKPRHATLTVSVGADMTRLYNALANANLPPGWGSVSGSSTGTVATPRGRARAAPMVATRPSGNVNVFLPVGSDPSATVAALQRWAGRNGSLGNAGVRSG